MNEQRKPARGPAAATLPPAAKLSEELKAELRHRNCHQALLRYCSQELVHRSLFHAMNEAAKTIPDRIRRHTGLAGDGATLFDQALGTTTQPLIRINALADDSDLSEQKKFNNLLVGIHGHYCNPRAHRAGLGSFESRQDFFDAFALFSYVHRRLDLAGVQP